MAKEYTKEDLAAFKRKDQLNGRQSAVKAASLIFEGKETAFEAFKAYADKVYEWLTQEQQFDVVQATAEKTSPQLTVQQKKVFDAVCAKMPGVTVSTDDLLSWSKSKGYEGILPKNMASVNEIIAYLEEK